MNLTPEYQREKETLVCYYFLLTDEPLNLKEELLHAFIVFRVIAPTCTGVNNTWIPEGG